jgi:hypothetical protein
MNKQVALIGGAINSASEIPRMAASATPTNGWRDAPALDFARDDRKGSGNFDGSLGDIVTFRGTAHRRKTIASPPLVYMLG